MEHLDEDLQNRFNELPLTIQTAITESHWQEKLRNIANSNKLRVDEGAILETETALVMFGFEDASDYINNLKDQMKIPEEKAIQIATEVDDEIFKTIKEKLIVAGELKSEEEIEEESREKILHDIEDPIENEIALKTAQSTAPIISQNPTSTQPEPNTTDQKLSGATTGAVQNKVYPDPYREII